MHIFFGKTAFVITAIAALILALPSFDSTRSKQKVSPVQEQKFSEITGKIKKGETLFEIFKKKQLALSEFYKIREASASVYRWRELSPGHRYKIVCADEEINSFSYHIDDNYKLKVCRTERGYVAEKVPIEYTKRLLHIGGPIKENLISSMGKGHQNFLLALQLSDIFECDIDFNTDLQKDDSYRVVVEGFYRDGKLKKYGLIFAAEFINNKKTYYAYAFTQNGKTEYYDEMGRALKKAFLNAPLNFRRISSYFTSSRYHPILKILRPHHGLDYAAAMGTPVSATGNGKIIFAAPRGQYGKLIIVEHFNGYRTYYGHLSRISRKIHTGTKVKQGEIIGYVGATGLATGPHLHYEVRIKDRPVNPLALKLPRSTTIAGNSFASFNEIMKRMNWELALTKFSVAVDIEKTGADQS